MGAKDVLMSKVNRVIELMLADGVQPSDIADNVFLDGYECVCYKKAGDYIIGEVTISEDEDDEERGKYTLRYVYNKKKRIERIEEEVKGKTELLWDREEIVTHLVVDIIGILKAQYSACEMDRFVTSLPHDLYIKICTMLNQVA